MENDLNGNENCFKLTRGSSYRGFESPEVDCSTKVHENNLHFFRHCLIIFLSPSFLLNT